LLRASIAVGFSLSNLQSAGFASVSQDFDGRIISGS
jgi:hypothetical protein